MQMMIKHLERFWFAPMPAERLAVIRICSGAFALWYLLTRKKLIETVIRTDAEHFAPVGLASWISDPLHPTIFMGIFWLCIGLGIAYLLGWKFRVTGIMFALLSLFVFSYRYSWSMIYHDNIALVIHLLIIALSPAADAYSLDARSIKIAQHNSPSWQFGWPVRLLCAATATTYFVSGVAKVMGELAWSWVDGTALRSQVAVDALRKELLGAGGGSPMFYWLYAHKELFLFMGLFALVVELGAPFVLWNKRSRLVWALSTWGMHWGILLLMGISFRYQLSGIIFLSFFQVEKIWPGILALAGYRRAATAEVRSQEPALVLFDGVCNFCNTSVRFVAERDKRARFHFASLQSEKGQALLRAQQLSAEISTIVLIERGRAYLRSTAVLRIVRRLGGIWPLAYLLIVIPSPIRDGVYAWFSRNRYRWFGHSETCPIPPLDIRRRFLDSTVG